jgi:Ca-activated chloride channel homolog
LRFLPDEDVWQTRFLAAPDMKDGTYSVRMILRDRNGHVYREAKTFVIASTPPTVRIALDRKRVRQGETVSLKVNASQSTRTLTAELEGLEPVSLRWNQEAHANTGSFQVPADLPAGTYKLTVTAEDIAHNLGTGEVQLEVVP